MNGSIAILLPDLRGGGAERVSVDLGRAFAELGHKITFVVMQARGELLEEATADFPVVGLNCARARKLPFALAKFMRRSHPDALIAAMWPLTAIAPITARLVRYQGRVVISEHGRIQSQYATWGSATNLGLRVSTFLGYRLASARLAVSKSVADQMSTLSMLGPDRFKIVHNPVRRRLQPTAEDRDYAERLWDNKTGPRILTVGSLKAVKNHELLLRSFAKIASGNARLMLVGQGTLVAHLRRLARDLGIAQRVIFAGFHVDPTPFYATANLFALSSDSEGLPTVIIEALAQGLPVVSTDCPSGPAEILENGRYGRLVPVGDAEALSRAMKESLDAKHDRDALKRRAADFAPEIAATKYLDLLFPK